MGQWEMMRETYVHLRVETGRYHVHEVEAALAKMEASRRAIVSGIASKWYQRKPGPTVGAFRRDPDIALMRRFERTRQAWSKVEAQKKRREWRQAVHDSKVRQQEAKRRRWDGREAFDDF